MEIGPATAASSTTWSCTSSSPTRRPERPEAACNLHEYAVGKYGDTFADNTGRLLKKGSRLRFDMHYFAIGEELNDRTEMAFIFYPKGYVPKYKVRSVTFRNLSERRARNPAEHGRPARRLFPPAEAGAHRRVSSRTCTCAARR